MKQFVKWGCRVRYTEPVVIAQHTCNGQRPYILNCRGSDTAFAISCIGSLYILFKESKSNAPISKTLQVMKLKK